MGHTAFSHTLHGTACRVLFAGAWLAALLTAGCGDRPWRYPKSDVVLVVPYVPPRPWVERFDSAYDGPLRQVPLIMRLPGGARSVATV